MDSTKRQEDMTPEDKPLRSEGVQYATGEEQRASTSSARKNEATGSKPKGHSVADVSGGERRVQSCKDLYSIGTWNVRSMNQGKLGVVKQEMTRLHIDILGISELKWTGMGEFNSDDHQVYYCGQESLRRNGVAFIVNKRVGKAVLGYSLQNDRMISVRIQGKPFNITIVQVYAPTTGAEEAEVDQFYEGLQHLPELTPKNDVLIIMEDWNAKVGSQKVTGITGKFGLGVQNEAGHRLVEFCQENTMVIANTLFQQPKRRLYTWTSPDGQHRNQIDYVLCRQRWRSSIQSVKTRRGADCGSDHELLVAKFRLKLKKVGKALDHSDLIDTVPEELWTEVRNIVQEAATKAIPKKKKCKKAKWLSEEALQIAEERREAKGKGERERYTQLNAEFQRIARRDKNAFLNEQCKEIEENNRIGRTRDLWKFGKQQWPQYWKRSVYIPILKKGNAKECSNYRTIALISHASKVMLKILQARLQQYVERELPEVQAGFRRGRGTRVQIANICWIMEKAREFQKNIYFCFIDHAKAFDCVDHNKLWQVLKEMGRSIMRKAGLDESPVGIKIAGRNINNLRYADDTTLMAESEEELKSLLMRVKEESAKVGLKLNIKKTKIMASGPLTPWQIDGEEMEVVTDFILGSKITADEWEPFGPPGTGTTLIPTHVASDIDQLPITDGSKYLIVTLLRNYWKSKVKNEWLSGKYSNIHSRSGLPEKSMYPMDVDTWGEILEAELERKEVQIRVLYRRN
ncbi:Craniofacial development protein 2 [Varanus komodoensis]|nr:Craniofacial development protein 2 [Varanus komodoensis]